MALLCDPLCEQLNAVALSSGVPSVTFAHRPDIVYMDPRDPQVVGTAWTEGQSPARHCLLAGQGRRQP